MLSLQEEEDDESVGDEEEEEEAPKKKSAKKPAAKKATAAKGGVDKKGKGGGSSCLKDSCAVKVSQCCKGPCCMCMSESAAPVVKPAACHDGGVCCLPAHTAAV